MLSPDHKEFENILAKVFEVGTKYGKNTYR